MTFSVLELKMPVWSVFDNIVRMFCSAKKAAVLCAPALHFQHQFSHC